MSQNRANLGEDSNVGTSRGHQQSSPNSVNAMHGSFPSDHGTQRPCKDSVKQHNHHLSSLVVSSSFLRAQYRTCVTSNISNITRPTKVQQVCKEKMLLVTHSWCSHSKTKIVPFASCFLTPLIFPPVGE